MFCPKCGAQNPNGAKFCSGCGAPMPRPAGAMTPVMLGSVVPAQTSGAKPKRSKKPFIIAAVATVAVIAVVIAVRFITLSATPSGKPVSTMHLGLSEAQELPKGTLGLGSEMDLGYSLNGDSISFIWMGKALKGKVQSTRQSGDSTVYEVGNLDYDGQDAGRSSSNLSAASGLMKFYVFAPKGATTGNPVGQWGITVIVDGGSAKNATQHKLTFDKDGKCSYVLSTASLGSDASDALTADPTKDLASLDGGNSVITMNGSWTKGDADGQFSVDLNGQAQGQDAGELTGSLELSDVVYSSCADHYYPDGM